MPRRTDADRLRTVAVVVAMMVCGGRRRSGVMQLDRLTLRGVEISHAPGFLALANFGGRCRAFKRDHCFERGQPLSVVSGVGRHRGVDQSRQNDISTHPEISILDRGMSG